MVLDVHAALLLQAPHDSLVCAAQRRMERHVWSQSVLPTFGAVRSVGSLSVISSS